MFLFKLLYFLPFSLLHVKLLLSVNLFSTKTNVSHYIILFHSVTFYGCVIWSNVVRFLLFLLITWNVARFHSWCFPLGIFVWIVKFLCPVSILLYELINPFIIISEFIDPTVGSNHCNYTAMNSNKPPWRYYKSLLLYIIVGQINPQRDIVPVCRGPLSSTWLRWQFLWYNLLEPKC